MEGIENAGIKTTSFIKDREMIFQLSGQIFQYI